MFSICSHKKISAFLLAAMLTAYDSASASHPNYQELMKRNAQDGPPWNHVKLIDTEGKTFTADDHRGKIILIDFFFTSCPNICPPQTAGLVKVWDKLSAKEKRSLVFLSISLDAQNDTQEKILAYKKRFGITASSWIFAKGSAESVAQLSQYFGTVQKNADPLLHKGRLYLIGPDGLFLTSYASAPVDSPRVAAELAQAVRALIKS